MADEVEEGEQQLPWKEDSGGNNDGDGTVCADECQNNRFIIIVRNILFIIYSFLIEGKI